MGTITTVNRVGEVRQHRTSRRTTKFRSIGEAIVDADLSGVRDAPEIEEITIQGGALPIVDLSPLEAHPKLSSLTLEQVAQVDLTPLRSCPALASIMLRIAGDRALSLEPLAGHPTLESISIGCENQTALDLAPLREIPQLNRVSVAGGEWRELDLRPLSTGKLRDLTLSNQYIESVDLEHVGGAALEGIFLQDLECRHLDLEPLARCPQLRRLSIQRFTKLDHGVRPALALGPLAALERLEWLSFHQTELAYLDVGPLAKLRALRYFEPPNYKDMVLSPTDLPIEAPGLLKWKSAMQVLE